MTSGDTMMAEPPQIFRAKTPPSTTPAAIEAPVRNDPPVTLDMGEASREQGFRLNGCR